MTENLENADEQEVAQQRFTIDGFPCKSPCEEYNGIETCLCNIDGQLEKRRCREILDYNALRKSVASSMKYVQDDIKTIETKLNEQVKLLDIELTSYDQNYEKFEKYQEKYQLIEEELAQMTQVEEKIKLMKQTYSQYAQTNYQNSLKVDKYAEDFKKFGNANECSNTYGYDVFPIGTGLVGHYYDNVYFEGSPKSRVEPNLRLTFIDSPIKDVNPYNFSLKLEGFVRAPVSGYYYFYVESDDGVLINLNNDRILKDKFLEVGFKDWLEELKANVKESLSKGNYTEYVKSWAESNNNDSKKSKEVYLNANEMYYIEIFYRHSVHNSAKLLDDQGFLNIYWEVPGKVRKLVMAKDFLYEAFVKQKLKLENFDNLLYERVYAFNNQLAYTNSSTDYISDLPRSLQGALFLRTKRKFTERTVKFNCNSECIVYVAVPKEDAAIVPEYFIDEDYLISQLSVSAADLDALKSGTTTQVFTKNERPFKIYRYNYPQGLVYIQFLLDTIIQESQLMIFVEFDFMNYNQFSCGGYVLRLTDTSLQNYKGEQIYQDCKSSTHKDNEHVCSAAFSNDPTSEGWITNPQKATTEDWIEIEFNQFLYPLYIEFIQWGVDPKKILKVKLFYNDDNFELIDLDQTINQPDIIRYDLKNVSATNRIKIVIVETNKPDEEHMMLFRIYGTICWSIKQLTKKNDYGLTKLDRMYGSDYRKPIYLNCTDSLNALKNYNIIRGEDMSIWIHCNSGCSKNLNSHIYGINPFSERSSVCKAARYLGITTEYGGSFKIYVLNGLKKYDKGEQMHGIFAEAGKPTRKAFEVMKYENENTIMVSAVVGQTVEVFHEGKWQEGAIREVISENQIKWGLKSDPQVEGEATWPPNKSTLAPCGTFVNAISDCSAGSNNSIRINFGPASASFAGYLHDSGQSFRDHEGVKYGWNRDMSQYIKQDPGATTSPLNTYIKFNSDPKSRYCNSQVKAKYLCERVNWQIQLPNRMWIVKVTVGDMETEAVQNLQANNVSIVSHILTNKKTYTNQAYVNVSNNRMIIEATCYPLTKNQRIDGVPNCNLAWTGIMTIELTPVYPSYIKSLKNNYRKVCNKEMYVGGRCLDKSPENCLYSDPYEIGTHLCTTPNYKLLQMPRQDCQASSLKYKCVKAKFNSDKDCERDCPFKCVDNVCIEE